MTPEDIKLITIKGEPIEECIETHISWVLIGKSFVYKLKKPVQFSFVDFSTIEKRKYYCEQELVLNNRLTKGMYLDVVPVYSNKNKIEIGYGEGSVIDYAVKMIKQNVSKQMHVLLEKNKVKGIDIIRIAQKIALFHKNTSIIEDKFDAEVFNNTFNDIINVAEFIAAHIGKKYAEIVLNAVTFSSSFIIMNGENLNNRVERKMIRDCHGDLHSGNIFIEEEPIIFDCIEFNPAFRQIDLQYEIAFFCMDLESFGRRDLTNIFLSQYKFNFPEVFKDKFDEQLFIYYKLFRANVKVKVLALKAQQHIEEGIQPNDADEIKRYLRLMHLYHHALINLK